MATALFVIGAMAFLAYLAGFTSIMGSLVSATNSQARLIFNSGREGLLPPVTARITRKNQTPWVAFVIYLVVALGLVFGFGCNLALPVYYHKVHPDQFSMLRHLILPLLGVAAIAFPLYELVKPGQPAPFDRFPWITLGLIAAGLLYALILNQRDRTLASRIGSVVADAD